MKHVYKVLTVILFYTSLCNGMFAEQGVDYKTSGTIKGRITDSSKQTLPGATVIVKSIHTGVTSDANGYYTLSNLRPGIYDVKVSYVGYTPKIIKIKVINGKTLEENITLDEGATLHEINIIGAFSGQRRALQQQKSKMGIVNVVSADQVGKFPDSNIGDALKRISGVNVQYDQGEARYGQVRGTSADYTSVTIDGDRLPSASGDTRNIQLDLIPADMVQTIELNKVVTSDMDGDAIGGEINLITKSTPSHRILNATVGSGYNWISEKPQLNLGLTYGNRFFNNKLGIMLAASYQYAPGGSDNTEFTYVNDGKDNIVLNKAEVRQYYVTRERQSYSAAFDYKFNPANKIWFKAIYNKRNDWENRYRITYKKLDSSDKKQSVVLQTKGGDNGDDKNARLERQQTYDFNLGGEHELHALAINWGVSFSRASEDKPNERYFGISLKSPFSSSFQDVSGRQPYSNIQIPDIEGNNWTIDELTNSNRHIYENEWKGKLDFTLPIGNGGEYGKLKFGGKFASKVKDRDTKNYEYKDVIGDEWKNHLTSEIRNGFMPGDQYPIGTDFVSKKYLGSIDFNTLTGTQVLEDAAGNYHANESIKSGYIRYDRQLSKKSDLIIGFRVENTNLKYSGFNLIANNDGNESITGTGSLKNHYTNLLPSVLYKFNINDNCKLRASFTKTLARPKYTDLIPNVNYNVQDATAEIGNENLRPTTSNNFDLSSEYYFKSVGLVSLGVFYKDLHNVIVTEKWVGSAKELPSSIGNADYVIEKPNNAYDGGIFGTELAYERDFGFISPSLKCIGFYGTYTYTHSTTRNYKFEHRIVADGEKIKMQGTPEHTANASLYFEKSGVNIRLSYNAASSFIDEMGTEAALDRYYDHVNYLDLNASFTFGKKFKTTIYADATNLLNQPLRYYQGTKERTMQVEYYGARINCGIKINL